MEGMHPSTKRQPLCKEKNAEGWPEAPNAECWQEVEEDLGCSNNFIAE